MIKKVLSTLFILSFISSPVLASELQDKINHAKSGDVIELDNKTYHERIIIDKPVTLSGQKNTVIDGEHKGTVVQVKSKHVILKNMTIKNSGRSRSSAMEASCVRNMESHNQFINLKLHTCYHGMYLNIGDDTKVINNDITGYLDGNTGSKGYGIYIKKTNGNLIKGNQIKYSRDGIFFEYSNDNKIYNNKISKTRYGLHYMYSNFNTFKGNEFIANIGGAAVMHSDNIVLKNNKFSFNQGSQAFGLIVQGSRDIEIKNNEFHLNQRGLYIEQSTLINVHDNEFFNNKVGMEIWDSASELTFTKNKYNENKVPVVLVGKSNNLHFNKNKIGNYWQEPVFDLNQNGVGDTPYKQSSTLGTLLKENELAYLFINSPAISIFERGNRLLNPNISVIEDDFPLIQRQKGNAILMGGIIFALMGIIIFVIRSRKKVK